MSRLAFDIPEVRGGEQAQPDDAAKREANARALWRDARTPELRAHLRRLYPDLFAHAPEPPPPRPFPLQEEYPDPKAEREREALLNRWPDEFRDGARCALLREYPGDRERGGYPRGFHQWLLDRRNAWFAGFNLGHHQRETR